MPAHSRPKDGVLSHGHDGQVSRHPQLVKNSRICAGTGAVTVTGGLFFDIGTVTSRECR